MTIKVHGGIITDQMLKGKFTHYSIAGDFAYTISDGTVIIPGATVEGGNPNTVNEFLVGPGMPVPGSAAEYVLKLIMEKCTVSQIKLVATGTDGTDADLTAEVQISIENTSNGWNTTKEGPFDPMTGLDTNSNAATQMQTVINNLPDVTVPDTSTTGAIFSFGTITVTEVEFKLG